MLQAEKAEPYSLVRLELGPVPLMLQSRKGLPKYDLKINGTLSPSKVGPKQHCVQLETLSPHSAGNTSDLSKYFFV
jgi:hypothetical protein